MARAERVDDPMNFRGMLAAVVALATHPACLAGPGRLAPPPPAPAQHAAASAPAVVAPSDVPAAPTAVPPATAPPETTTTPPAPRCTATVRAEVHLRPTATPRTVGAPWPAGTTFEVLGVDPWMRREIPGDDDAGVLAEVRVVASGERGWTFVRYTELAPECPVFAELPARWGPLSTTPEERSDCTRAPRHLPVLWYTERGPRRFRPQVLRCCLSAENWRVVERLDVDGDGVGDEVVRTDRDCMCTDDHQLFTGDEAGAAVALLRRPEGWLGVDVVREAGPDRDSHCTSMYDGTLRAGGAVYFRWTFIDSSAAVNRSGLPARVSYYPMHQGLTRIDRCGVARVVARVLSPLAGGCTWTGSADGSVELVCRRPARRARLRWDEARFELVPERPPMPRRSSERW